MTNHFANVQKVVPITAKKANEKRRVPLTGIATLAALDAHIAGLEGLRAKLRTKIDEAVLNEHVREGMRTKGRPETFYAVDGVAEATCMLKKRGTGTKVSDETAKLLRAAGITVEKKTVVEDLIMFNVTYELDSKVMKRVAAKLFNDPLIPRDVILHQVGQTAEVLGDKALDELFRQCDRKTIEMLLPVVSTTAMQTRTQAAPGQITALVKQARTAA